MFVVACLGCPRLSASYVLIARECGSLIVHTGSTLIHLEFIVLIIVKSPGVSKGLSCPWWGHLIDSLHFVFNKPDTFLGEHIAHILVSIKFYIPLSHCVISQWWCALPWLLLQWLYPMQQCGYLGGCQCMRFFPSDTSFTDQIQKRKPIFLPVLKMHTSAYSLSS